MPGERRASPAGEVYAEERGEKTFWIVRIWYDSGIVYCNSTVTSRGQKDRAIALLRLARARAARAGGPCLSDQTVSVLEDGRPPAGLAKQPRISIDPARA